MCRLLTFQFILIKDPFRNHPLDAIALFQKILSLYLQALYGAMNSFVGSETFHEICEKTEIRSWFERMREAVDSKAGAALLDKRSQKRS